jgi:hypothetical protein
MKRCLAAGLGYVGRRTLWYRQGPSVRLAAAMRAFDWNKRRITTVHDAPLAQRILRGMTLLSSPAQHTGAGRREYGTRATY